MSKYLSILTPQLFIRLLKHASCTIFTCVVSSPLSSSVSSAFFCSFWLSLPPPAVLACWPPCFHYPVYLLFKFLAFDPLKASSTSLLNNIFSICECSVCIHTVYICCILWIRFRFICLLSFFTTDLLTCQTRVTNIINHG